MCQIANGEFRLSNAKACDDKVLSSEQGFVFSSAGAGQGGAVAGAIAGIYVVVGVERRHVGVHRAG
jgi:hypothetical protein